MSQENARKFVPVAEFRRECDALYRQVNVHYHSCVFAAEVESWVVIAERCIAELEGIDCKRANAFDREYHANALQKARERVGDASARIERLKAEEAARSQPEQTPPRARTVLRLVSSR